MRILAFIKKETVLSIAVLLAVASAFVVVPDQAYLDYIDFRTGRDTGKRSIDSSCSQSGDEQDGNGMSFIWDCSFSLIKTILN